MIIGLAVALCAFGALGASAYAKTPEPIVFGKFKSTVTGAVKGHGEAGEMTIGPYKFESGCEKELTSKGEVLAGETETFAETVNFTHCIAKRKLGGGIEEAVSVTFHLGMEFHSNGYLEFGEGAGVKINEAKIQLKNSKSYCEVTIPAQTVPQQAEKKPEKEYEVASFNTEKEKLEGAKLKQYGEFRERLDIEWELKGINANVKITPKCQYKLGEEGKFNKGTGEVEFGGGKMEGELEALTVKGGNLSFVPAV